MCVAVCFVFMEGSGSEKVEIVSDVVPLRQKLLGFKRISLVLSFLLSCVRLALRCLGLVLVSASVFGASFLFR